MVSKFVNGALGQTRTGTPVKATDFESVASTNSATRAKQASNITESFLTSSITLPELLKVRTLHPLTVSNSVGTANSLFKYKINEYVLPKRKRCAKRCKRQSNRR